MNVNEYLSNWAACYKKDLIENILPFWLKNGLDRKHGGVYTCLDRDGSLMDTTKSVWFQGRFGFIAAYAYNNIEKNPEWLAASKSCIDFIEAHCFDADGRMYFEVMEDGTPLRKRRYVFSEGFAAIAMSEYAIASGDHTYAEKALELFKRIMHFLNTPGILEPKYLDTLKSQGHSITMILVNTASRIRAAINAPLLTEQIDRSIKALRTYFMHPEFKALLEMVGPDGEFIDSINGRTINPGHCIETAWFILEEAKYRNWDKELVDMALTILDWSWDWGWDKEYGGIYWSLNYDGTPKDTTKHTYNQAFCIYALSSYYEASGDAEALELAKKLFTLIETTCMDEVGYLEAFTRDFKPESNEKLSENGVLADKTMNTLLHVFEAYTELYRVSGDEKVRRRLLWIMNVFAEKVYNPKLHRQEVFFDKHYNTILNLHSYGHDIETAWLIDRGCKVLDDPELTQKMYAITRDLTAQIYKVAFDGHSLANECDRGVVNVHRVWWVQAETVIGFLNGYEKEPEKTEYLEAAEKEWAFIRDHVIDKRPGSEWFWEVDPEGNPYPDRPIVEPWKCPYHNGRMCMEVLQRIPG